MRLIALLLAILLTGASYRTENFVVTASTAQYAREVAESAETERKTLAVEWLGAELPRWGEPVPLVASIGPQLQAGGVTSFSFDNGVPGGWSMRIQGSHERVLGSVVPHEVLHTVFATHFGCPLPRWADEGACTTVEEPAERRRQTQRMIEFLSSKPLRSIAFNRMFAMREYPPDILPLYAQGHSLCAFLLPQGGKRHFVQYIGEGLRSDWNQATRDHYAYADLSDLQLKWLTWVRSGSPAIEQKDRHYVYT